MFKIQVKNSVIDYHYISKLSKSVEAHVFH